MNTFNKSILCHMFVALTLLVGSAYIIYRLVDDIMTRIPISPHKGWLLVDSNVWVGLGLLIAVLLGPPLWHRLRNV